MPVFAKPNLVFARAGRWLAVAMIVGALQSATLALAAGFKVSSVQPRALGSALHLTGGLELGLTGKVEEALSNGIPLELAIDVRLYRQRVWLWDETVGTWTLRRQLRYHALSGQYLVSGDGGAVPAREGFASLNEALTQLGSLEDVALPLRAPLAPESAFRIGVRVVLDIEALPSLLRPVAYTSRAWDLNSGWTTWKVER